MVVKLTQNSKFEIPASAPAALLLDSLFQSYQFKYFSRCNLCAITSRASIMYGYDKRK